MKLLSEKYLLEEDEFESCRINTIWKSKQKGK